MERLPTRFGVVGDLAVQDPDDRVQRDEARAGHEPQIAEVQQEVARAVPVQAGDLVDQPAEVGRIELAGQGYDGDRDVRLDRLDGGVQAHLTLLGRRVRGDASWSGYCRHQAAPGARSGRAQRA